MVDPYTSRKWCGDTLCKGLTSCCAATLAGSPLSASSVLPISSVSACAMTFLRIENPFLRIWNVPPVGQGATPGAG
jgi:hypothetical protein